MSSDVSKVCCSTFCLTRVLNDDSMRGSMYEEIKRFTPIVASFSLIQCPLHNTSNTVGDIIGDLVVAIDQCRMLRNGFGEHTDYSDDDYRIVRGSGWPLH